MIPAGSQSPHSIRVLRVMESMTAIRKSGIDDQGISIRYQLFRYRVSNLWSRCLLPRGHPQGAVEPYDFAIQIPVLDHVLHQRGELRRLAEQFWKWHRGGEALLGAFRQRVQHRRRENSRRNSIDADAELRELARRRQNQTDHTTF